MKKLLALYLVVISLVFLFCSSVFAGKVFLKSDTIDTSTVVQAAGAYLEHVPGSGYYIVVFKGPITEDHKSALAAAGAELLEYLPDYAFLVRVDHSKVKSIRKLDGIEWIGAFKPDYKVSGKPDKSKRAGEFIVKLFPGYDLDYLSGKIRQHGAKAIDCAKMRGDGVCRVIAEERQLTELAKSGAVAWIEPYVQPQLCNNAAGIVCKVPEVRQRAGLYGAGQIVGVADAGLDTGNMSTISADFFGRIDKAYALRRPNDWSDLNGHGSHVVGSLLGSGALSSSNPGMHSYDSPFASVAPEARLVFQSIGDEGSYVFPPLHLAELFQPAYDDGVRVHSNSWGSAVSGQYTAYSNEVDQFAWDHKDFTLVFAVGNEGRDLNQDGIINSDSLYAPATAKNCISVGATENNCTSGGHQIGYGVAWPQDYPVAPIKYDLMSNNPFGIAAFSGRGPTDDGRIKPDICAPGTNVISCRSHSGSSASGWGVYNTDYIYWGGTSMSTPQIAGAAALVREYYQKEKGTNPSSALIKATLLNGAKDIAPGQYGTTSKQEVFTAPDNSQGWGRLDVNQCVSPDQPYVNEFTDESSSLTTGAYREYNYSVIDNSVPFKATLVWTDYPGAVHAAKELVNDLDLIITSPSGNIYPTGAVCDHKNNVEQVTINQPELGTYTIQIKGYNVPMGPQDYALVVSGGMPNTYISGTVTSSSGAGVQGALISLVCGGNIKRIYTNQSGSFTTHIAPGTYSVQINKPGWKFTPNARMVVVSDSPVENVNFQGQGAPGSVSGTITSAIGGVVSHVLESPHPYLNNSDQVYTIAAHESATRVRVHFAEIDLMNDGDTVYVLDANDVVKNTYTYRGEDIWSSWINGNVVKIRIVTNDYGNTGYGFYIDGYETDLIEQGGLTGTELTLSPGGYTVVSGEGGVYSFASVPPGTYTIAASKAHWKFQPNMKSIDIPAGGSLQNVDFQAFPPGSITGEVRVSNAQVQSVNIQSEHPYQNYWEEVWQITGDPNATRIRLHFDKLITEPAFDLIYILDGSDNVIEAYTAECFDFWTPWIPGNVAKIMLLSDEGNTEYGFYCDKYEVELQGAPLAGVTVTLLSDGRTATTSESGIFSFADVDVGSHVITPSMGLWVFDPVFANANISAGVDQQLFFYAKLGALTSPATVKSLFDNTQLTLKNVVVSAVFNGCFYVQCSQFSGLCVVSSVSVNEGDVVDVTGTLTTVNGERKLNVTAVNIH